MLEQIFAKVSTELIPEHLILPKILKNCCYLEPPQNTCFIDNPDLIYLFDILVRQPGNLRVNYRNGLWAQKLGDSGPFASWGGS